MKDVSLLANAFEQEKMYVGRMVCGSKSHYREMFPNHNVYFNANIFEKDLGKVWYGDLDLTVDAPRLQRIAQSCGVNLYVLREMDGRFENENLPFKKFEQIAVAVFIGKL